jgi:hypothetical protein
MHWLLHGLNPSSQAHVVPVQCALAGHGVPQAPQFWLSLTLQAPPQQMPKPSLVRHVLFWSAFCGEQVPCAQALTLQTPGSGQVLALPLQHWVLAMQIPWQQILPLPQSWSRPQPQPPDVELQTPPSQQAGSPPPTPAQQVFGAAHCGPGPFVTGS